MAVSPTQVNLSWMDNAIRESGFRIQRSTNGGSFQQIAEMPSGVTTYQDTSATPGASYTYEVLTVLNTTPVNSSTHTELDSAPSATASATTFFLPTAPLAYLSSLTPDPSSTPMAPMALVVSDNRSYFGNIDQAQRGLLQRGPGDARELEHCL